MIDGRKIVEELWPHHAEQLTEENWQILSDAAAKGAQINSTVVSPEAQSRDMFLTTLMIVYWTLRVVQLTLEVAKEVRDVAPEDKLRAVINAVTQRLSPDTPKQVKEHLDEIITAAQQP